MKAHPQHTTSAHPHRLAAVLAACAGLLLVSAQPAHAATAAAHVTAASSVSRVAEVSRGCARQNAEVEQAVDPARSSVYEAWMGCGGIGFARSTDGGRTFDAPRMMPRSVNAKGAAWDPAVTVGPRGTVYVAYMLTRGTYTFPVVAASFDGGRSFGQVSSLVPPVRNNWGDRDFIAAAPDGTLYVTWDYGPSAKVVTYICSPIGSCAFATGDLNAVIQKSTDGGRTWGPIVPISPGFPASGGDSAPLVVERDGRIDVLYQGYTITNTTTYTMKPAHEYFTSSVDGGATWSAPVMLGEHQPGLTMSLAEWWIDGSIGIDSGGNLYATWDTQVDGSDVAWLCTSSDHGRSWSHRVRVNPDHTNAPHIVEVVGAGAGSAYVGWLSDSSSSGYALYLRPYSLARGWLSAPLRISGGLYGVRRVWPGDTFGISTLSPSRAMIGWGSAVAAPPRKPRAEIYAAVVAFTAG